MGVSWVVYACLGLGLFAALVGGVLQSFSDFVMKGLLQAQPAGGMESMQQLNRTVFRSAFIASLIGLVPATIGFALYAKVKLSGTPQTLIIASAVVYFLFVFVVTVAGNVPMNEQLDGLAPTGAEGHAYWAVYGRVWTWWNHVRMLGSTASAVCLLLAAVRLAATAPAAEAGREARLGAAPAAAVSSLE